MPTPATTAGFHRMLGSISYKPSVPFANIISGAYIAVPAPRPRSVVTPPCQPRHASRLPPRAVCLPVAPAAGVKVEVLPILYVRDSAAGDTGVPCSSGLRSNFGEHLHLL